MGGEKITKKNNWFLAILDLIVQPLVHIFEVVIFKSQFLKEFFFFII